MSAQTATPPVALVVPCYNERGRVDVSRFGDAANESNLQICFVDDGSSDGTGEFLDKKVAGNPRLSVLRGSNNQGKAAAVREGVLALLQRCPEAEWVGFWDADLSSPLSEVPRMLEFHQLEDGGFDAIWCSRVMRAGSKVERPGRRHLFGRMFATASGLLLGVRAYDTQCGAKLFRREVVQEVFGEPFISRWIFDVEIYCRMGHDRILEYPVKEWRDVPGSKVKIAREMFRVGGDLLRIRKVYGRKGEQGSGDRDRRSDAA